MIVLTGTVFSIYFDGYYFVNPAFFNNLVSNHIDGGNNSKAKALKVNIIQYFIISKALKVNIIQYFIISTGLKVNIIQYFTYNIYKIFFRNF